MTTVKRGTALATRLPTYDVQHEYVLAIISDCCWYFEDEFERWNDVNEEVYSIIKWTMNEIVTLVETHISEPPLKIIDDFRNKFERFSKSCLNADNVYFCEWVLEITDYVIDQFM